MKRSVVKLDEKKARAKTTRWNTIAESAAKQSGRSICPEVMLPLPFAEAIQESGSADRILVPYENARGMQATREAMTALGARTGDCHLDRTGGGASSGARSKHWKRPERRQFHWDGGFCGQRRQDLPLCLCVCIIWS